MKDPRFIIISGLSGSGKSQALKCFEDLGFFCVDNLPPPLFPKFADLCVQSVQDIRQVALGIDVRERVFLDQFLEYYERFKSSGYQMEILFLEANDEILLRRFSESRRPHPMTKDVPVLEAIRLERVRLSDLRNQADAILDTSDYSVHKLKDEITSYDQRGNDIKRIQITLISFGFKYGIPPELDLLFDVRFLPNPNFVAQLRDRKGTEPSVMEYVLQNPMAQEFLTHLRHLFDFILPLHEEEGRSYLSIGIGCTGGLHRSVALVEHLKTYVKGKGYEPTIRHRDIQQPH